MPREDETQTDVGCVTNIVFPKTPVLLDADFLELASREIARKKAAAATVGAGEITINHPTQGELVVGVHVVSTSSVVGAALCDATGCAVVALQGRPRPAARTSVVAAMNEADAIDWGRSLEAPAQAIATRLSTLASTSPSPESCSKIISAVHLAICGLSSLRRVVIEAEDSSAFTQHLIPHLSRLLGCAVHMPAQHGLQLWKLKQTQDLTNSTGGIVYVPDADLVCGNHGVDSDDNDDNEDALALAQQMVALQETPNCCVVLSSSSFGALPDLVQQEVDLSFKWGAPGQASGQDGQRPLFGAPQGFDGPRGFARIRGCEAAKKRLEEQVIWPLQQRARDRLFSIGPMTGIMIVGPQGSGKSLLARSLAEEARLFLQCPAMHDLVKSEVGESEKAMHAIFERARSQQPSMILFDDIHRLFPSAHADENTTMISVLAQLCAELDRLEQTDAVVVVGTAPSTSSVDGSLTRHGRLGLHINLASFPPTPAASSSIFSSTLNPESFSFGNTKSLPSK